jgi:hypothetical protein
MARPKNQLVNEAQTRVAITYCAILLLDRIFGGLVVYKAVKASDVHPQACLTKIVLKIFDFRAKYDWWCNGCGREAIDGSEVSRKELERIE